MAALLGRKALNGACDLDQLWSPLVAVDVGPLSLDIDVEVEAENIADRGECGDGGGLSELDAADGLLLNADGIGQISLGHLGIPSGSPSCSDETTHRIPVHAHAAIFTNCAVLHHTPAVHIWLVFFRGH